MNFVQKSHCKDRSAHLFTIIYKFYSPKTKYWYILRGEYHEEDVFAIKFYVKQHSKSDYKYSIITNKRDIGNILITCAKVVPLILKDYPKASFGIAASRSVDLATKNVERLYQNQRFQAYSYVIARKFGNETFKHIAYDKISSYLLLNKNCADIEAKEKAIIRMFQETYETLLDII